ncbi:MAG: hypothetical protein ACK43N_23535, partial [Pirellulaceae bacterium]
ILRLAFSPSCELRWTVFGDSATKRVSVYWLAGIRSHPTLKKHLLSTQLPVLNHWVEAFRVQPHSKEG